MVNAINVKKDIGVNNVKIIVVLIAKIIFVIILLQNIIRLQNLTRVKLHMKTPNHPQ